MIRPAPTPINRVPVIGPLTYGEQMGLAPRTLAAYRSDWADFVRWCAARGLEPLPAAGEAMAAYVDDRAATLRVGTLQRRLAAIRAVHLAAGLAVPSDAPGVTAAMTRARWRQRHVVAATNPITVEELRAMSRALPVTTIGVRDRAAILLGGPNPLVGPLAHHGGDEIDQFRVQLRSEPQRRDGRLFQVASQLVARGAAGVGHLAGDGVVERAAERIDVAGAADLARSDNRLGSDEIGRADDVLGATVGGGRRVGRECREAEIGELSSSCGRNE